jgi:uncharacterized membrane protein YdjX (TVP38/TMEM64 family)
MELATRLSILAVLLLITVFAGSGILGDIWQIAMNGDMTELSQYVRSFGNLAIIFSIFLGILINLSGLPTVIYSGANGIVFGFWIGFGLSWTAEIVGAILALVITRSLVGNRAEQYIDRHPELKAAYDFTGRRGFWALLVARLVPFTPSGLLNIAAAVSRISFLHYLVATAVGKIPSVMAEVYVGRDLFAPWEKQARLLLWAFLVLVLYICWRHYHAAPPEK